MVGQALATENPYAGQGSVLLDIGGDVGALVVIMPEEMAGEEVEIRPCGHDHPHGQVHHHGHDHDHGHDHQHHPHVAVVARPAGDRVVHSLVFGELLAGEYELYRRSAPAVELRVSISGAEVTEATWPH